MERLTQKNEFFEYVLPCQNVVGDNCATEVVLGETEYTCKKYIIGEAIKKIGELEDVLEKYRIENLDDFIKEYSSRNIKLANDNYILEQELADLKQKAIVPRFKIGDKVYANTVDYWENSKPVRHTTQEEVEEIVYFYKLKNYWLKDWKKEEIFATEEEARKRLEELKGE